MSFLLEDAAQLEDLCILLGRGVAGVTALSGRRSSRIVVVIVLGVELELVSACSRHCVVIVR